MAKAKRKGDKSKLESRLIVGGLKGMGSWMTLAVEYAKEKAPVDQGHLVRSIHEDERGPQEDNLLFTGRIGVGKFPPYARAHEFGSGVHALDPSERRLIPITAGYWTGKSEARALQFQWDAGPKPHPAYNEEKGLYYFHTIYHPGVRPANMGKGYLRYGAQLSKKEGIQLMVDTMIAELTR